MSRSGEPESCGCYSFDFLRNVYTDSHSGLLIYIPICKERELLFHLHLCRYLTFVAFMMITIVTQAGLWFISMDFPLRAVLTASHRPWKVMYSFHSTAKRFQFPVRFLQWLTNHSKAYCPISRCLYCWVLLLLTLWPFWIQSSFAHKVKLSSDFQSPVPEINMDIADTEKLS